jgi:hypothetical protein
VHHAAAHDTFRQLVPDLFHFLDPCLSTFKSVELDITAWKAGLSLFEYLQSIEVELDITAWKAGLVVTNSTCRMTKYGGTR